jgi:hypothetical protein
MTLGKLQSYTLTYLFYRQLKNLDQNLDPLFRFCLIQMLIECYKKTF